MRCGIHSTVVAWNSFAANWTKPRQYMIDIDAAMADQGEFVEIIARFVPRMIKMTPIEET